MQFARCLIIVSLIMAGACSGDPRASAASATVERSDAELTRVLDWQLGFRRLVARHRAEQEAVAQRAIASSPGVDNGLQQNPELRALLSRQRAEMQRFMATAPTGPTATAIGETLFGLGTSTSGPGGMALIYTPHRDDAALDAARTKYGRAFVSWMLDHEGTVNRTLGAGQ
jgi:hypothetical protein